MNDFLILFSFLIPKLLGKNYLANQKWKKYLANFELFCNSNRFLFIYFEIYILLINKLKN